MHSLKKFFAVVACICLMTAILYLTNAYVNGKKSELDNSTLFAQGNK